MAAATSRIRQSGDGLIRRISYLSAASCAPTGSTFREYFERARPRTTVTVDLDAPDEYRQMFEGKFPQALQP
jgi:hypothetical protein